MYSCSLLNEIAASNDSLDTISRDSDFDQSDFYICADQNTTAFKEVAIIRHPRIGEYAFGFITSSVVLQVNRKLLIIGLPKDQYLQVSIMLFPMNFVAYVDVIYHILVYDTKICGICY